MEHAGAANPLIVPQAASPNIDVKLNFKPVLGIGGGNCFDGNLYGDGFPNAEVFAINSYQQATMLATFATDLGPNWGPWTLIGNHNRPMASFVRAFSGFL